MDIIDPYKEEVYQFLYPDYEPYPNSSRSNEEQPSSEEIYQEEQQPSSENFYKEQESNPEQLYQEQPMSDQFYEEEPMSQPLYEEEPMSQPLYEEEQPNPEQFYQEEQSMSEEFYEEEPSSKPLYEKESMSQSLYDQQSNLMPMPVPMQTNELFKQTAPKFYQLQNLIQSAVTEIVEAKVFEETPVQTNDSYMMDSYQNETSFDNYAPESYEDYNQEPQYAPSTEEPQNNYAPESYNPDYYQESQDEPQEPENNYPDDNYYTDNVQENDYAPVVEETQFNYPTDNSYENYNLNNEYPEDNYLNDNFTITYEQNNQDGGFTELSVNNDYDQVPRANNRDNTLNNVSLDNMRGNTVVMFGEADSKAMDFEKNTSMVLS